MGVKLRWKEGMREDEWSSNPTKGVDQSRGRRSRPRWPLGTCRRQGWNQLRRKMLRVVGKNGDERGGGERSGTGEGLENERKSRSTRQIELEETKKHANPTSVPA